MDRRYVNNVAPMSYAQIKSSNSFIPTAASPPTKLQQSQIQQLVLQSQLQAQSQIHMKNPNAYESNASTYYQTQTYNNRSSTSTLTHQRNAGNSNSSQFQQNGQSKTMYKQFPSSQSQYGNTIPNHGNSSTANQMHNGNTYYGTLGQNPNQVNHNPNLRYANYAPVQKEHVIPSIQPVIKQIQQQQLSNKISQHYQPAETEGLPQTLVDSMRTLFDILDDSKVGKIRLSDIETRWDNDANKANGNRGNTGAEPLIKMGVLGFLRKVTPPDGLLTFDRFCAGLKLSLLTNNNNQNQFLQPQPQQPHAQIKNPQNPQFSLQQHVRNIARNLQSGTGKQQINVNNSQANNTKPNNSNENNFPVSSDNTAQRVSKIPSISMSKLHNSGHVPIASPNNRSKSQPPTNFGIYGTHGSNTAYQHPDRSQSNPEQGITVAMVHQDPAPNSKLKENTIQKYGDNKIGPLKHKKQVSNSSLRGKEMYQNAKNGSLDNLTSENNSDDRRNKKDRPPSAPLLDVENDEGYNNSAPNNKTERMRGRDDEQISNRNKGKDTSYDKRAVSLVTPRQRTLSMPQLHPSKLKPKSITLEDGLSLSPDSSQSVTSSGDGFKSEVQDSPKTLFKSQIPPSLIPGFHKRKSDSAVHVDNLNSSKSSQDNDPPPPKPPRNTSFTNATNMTAAAGPRATISVVIPEQPIGDSSGSSNGTITPSKPQIRNVLESWQKGKFDKPGEINEAYHEPNESASAAPPDSALVTSGNEISEKGEKKTNIRRRETARRHTVQSGIDFSTLKRLKQLEQERDVLQQGSSYIESAKDWYLKQLDIVDEKIALLAKGAPISEYWSECHEERLNLLGCRISEISSLLTALTDGSLQLPLHMNLQIPSHLSMKTITRLKEQNRQLTQEVSDCSHRVTQLESEKAMLLRQLFHQKNNIHPDETVYM